MSNATRDFLEVITDASGAIVGAMLTGSGVDSEGQPADIRVEPLEGFILKKVRLPEELLEVESEEFYARLKAGYHVPAQSSELVRRTESSAS